MNKLTEWEIIQKAMRIQHTFGSRSISKAIEYVKKYWNN